MRSTLLAIIASFIAELVSAIPNKQPAPTKVVENEYDPYGWSPNPTQAPNLELMKRAGLLDKRQASASLSSGQLVGYFAPNSVCGYISGSLGASLSCSSSSRCAAVAPIANIPGAIGCCPVGGTGCFFKTTCYNSAEISSSKCDHGCQEDVNVKLCPSAASPYCYGYTWPDISVTSWGCASSPASTKDTVLFTYLGETDKRAWSAYYYTPVASGDTNSDGGILTVPRSTNTSSTSSESSSSAAAGGGGAKKGGAGSHAGAIAGGVVGGLAVLGAVVLGIFFLLTRRKKQHNAATQPAHTNHTPTGTANGYSPQPMSAVPGSAASGYYGQDYNKHPPSSMGSPPPGHASVYGHYKDPNNPYDHRVSHFSEAGSPVPPYGPSGHMQQAPMELDATSSSTHYNAQGRPVYEAPADVPEPHYSPTGATHPPVS